MICGKGDMGVSEGGMGEEEGKREGAGGGQAAGLVRLREGGFPCPARAQRCPGRDHAAQVRTQVSRCSTNRPTASSSRIDGLGGCQSRPPPPSLPLGQDRTGDARPPWASALTSREGCCPRAPLTRDRLPSKPPSPLAPTPPAGAAIAPAPTANIQSSGTWHPGLRTQTSR